jgi:hypothetical protein
MIEQSLVLNKANTIKQSRSLCCELQVNGAPEDASKPIGEYILGSVTFSQIAVTNQVFGLQVLAYSVTLNESPLNFAYFNMLKHKTAVLMPAVREHPRLCMIIKR